MTEERPRFLACLLDGEGMSAMGLGQSLPMIGKLLGHTQVQTTARYAHLPADPMQAAEQVISNIASILNGRLLQSQDADAELA